MARIEEWGNSGQQNESARVAADYQNPCYHTGTVQVKINFELVWKRLKKNELARDGSDGFRGKWGEDSGLRKSRKQKLEKEEENYPTHAVHEWGTRPQLLLNQCILDWSRECHCSAGGSDAKNEQGNRFANPTMVRGALYFMPIGRRDSGIPREFARFENEEQKGSEGGRIQKQKIRLQICTPRDLERIFNNCRYVVRNCVPR